MQGKAQSHRPDMKTEPRPKAVSIENVSEIGGQYVHIRPKEVLYPGKGYLAPPTTDVSHPRGSQGRHK